MKESHINQIESNTSDIEFGPWNGDPSVPDLIFCVAQDLKALGYDDVDTHCVGICDTALENEAFGYCRRSIYTISIQWW